MCLFVGARLFVCCAACWFMRPCGHILFGRVMFACWGLRVLDCLRLVLYIDLCVRALFFRLFIRSSLCVFVCVCSLVCYVSSRFRLFVRVFVSFIA